MHGAGAGIVIADFDEAKGRAIVDELGDRCAFVKTDVTDPDSVSEAIEAAEGLGSLRISVAAHGSRNGGGRTLARDGEPLAQPVFEKVVTFFLSGTFNLMRLAAASMAKTEPLESGERGVLINTASIAAWEGTIGQVAYSAAKAGIVGMTLPAARDLAPLGIRVMTIAPGTFLTGAYGDTDPEALNAVWAPVVPFPKRMGLPEEYAQLALAIAENTYLNGESIRIDGGLRFTAKGAKL